MHKLLDKSYCTLPHSKRTQKIWSIENERSDEHNYTGLYKMMLISLRTKRSPHKMLSKQKRDVGTKNDNKTIETDKGRTWSSRWKG